MSVSRKTAVTKRPMAARVEASGASAKEPLKMRNSPTKPFKPGRPSEEKILMPMRPVSTGATVRRPPKSLRPRRPSLRRSMKPMKQKRAAAVMPWLKTWSRTPFIAAARSLASPCSAAVTAKMPSRQ